MSQPIEPSQAIRERLEATFLDYAAQALARREYEVASAYQQAAALVIATCVKVGDAVVSRNERSNLQLPDAKTTQGG